MEVIAEFGPALMVLAVIFGLWMTWGIGANDVANAMGTSVGSGALTVKQAIIVAAVFEFLGAFLAGGHVTKTIRKGIIDASSISATPEILIYGMLAALLAAGLWLAIASNRGWPVSTTHSIVGAIVGFAIAGIGIESVQWGKIGLIAASWVISPLLGGILAFMVMTSIRRLILNSDRPFEMAKRYAPFYLFPVGFVISLVTFFKGLKHLNLDLGVGTSVLLSLLVGLLVAYLGHRLIRRVKTDEDADRTRQFARVEKIFAPMMIFTACAMAFAHGSNDVANGIGPLAAIAGLVESGGAVAQKSGLPLWILALGGAGIVLGLATYGFKVMKTIGTKITELTPTRGFSAELAAAGTVVLASRTGIPVSTTHILVGAVIGVGFARGVGALDMRVITNIVISWVVTLPIGALLAALFFYGIRGAFG